MNQSIRKIIERATVSLPKKQGQGVLVPGNLIVTAAHCIDFSVEGGMVLGDRFIEEFRANRTLIKATPLAVEPVSDIAVIGPLDSQDAPRAIERVEAFCDCTTPVRVCVEDFKPFTKVPVHIYTHKGK